MTKRLSINLLRRVGLLALLLWAFGFSNAQAALTPVAVAPTASLIDLIDATEMLVDPEGVVDIPNVERQTWVQRRPFAGITDHVVWAHIALRNTGDAPLERWLDTGNRTLWELDVFIRSASGASGEWAHHTASSRRPFAERPLPTANFVIPVTLPPGEVTDIYLRLHNLSTTPTNIRPALWEADAYREHARHETTQWYFYWGALASLGVLNLLLWIYLRDVQYGWYVASLASLFTLTSFVGGGYGDAFQVLLGESPRLNMAMSFFGWAAGGTIPAWFVLRLLQAQTVVPRLFVAWAGFSALYVAGHLLRAYSMLANDFPLLAMLKQITAIQLILGLAMVTVVLIVIVIAVRRRILSARYVAAAYSPVFAVALFVAWDIYAGNLPKPHYLMWVSLYEMLVMALALADRFYRDMQSRERLTRLRRFFSPAVAERIVSDGADDFLKPRRREIVVVFVDLRGYTAFTDTHSADDVMQMLGEFHEAMGAIIMAHGGTLERFAGDGLMIFFNDPIEIPDPAEKALAMATAMQQRFGELNQQWQTRGYTLAMGIGIAQGVATLGAIGFEGRRDYGAIGGVTNLAARLCGEAKGGQILVSGLVAAHVGASAVVRPIGPLALKGFALPQAAFEVLGGIGIA